jgi:hypothetical protein
MGFDGIFGEPFFLCLFLFLLLFQLNYQQCELNQTEGTCRKSEQCHKKLGYENLCLKRREFGVQIIIAVGDGRIMMAKSS